MTPVTQLLLLFFALCAAGAVAGFLVPVRSRPITLSVIGSFAALALLGASALLLLTDTTFDAELWPVLSLGTMHLGADRLSALFLLVAGLVFLPVAIYSGSYLAKYAVHYSLSYFSVLYHALIASVVLVLIADDVVSFLVAWEIVSALSYLLVTFDHEREESSYAGFVMLAMSEVGAVAVAIAFILMAGVAGGLDFSAIRSAALGLSGTAGIIVFLLSFFGFAVKAGLVPLNSWLPLAHPVAPTNVSALLSAVIVNLGIYGIMRANLDLAPPNGPIPGLIVLVVGSFSALFGILYATVESEMKRLLAHSTIENMGIVTAGLGAAMVFLATDHPVIAGIALIAALYHTANHSIYKALLFVGTGAVEAGAGTRDLDLLGGIVRRMPWVGALFLVGVLSISALPPLNGFVSEWLTLQTVLRSAALESIPIKVVFAISGALLALTAGLAVTCFAKVFAMGFLGMPRSAGARSAGEAALAPRVSMGLLAAICIALGVLPTYVIPVLDRVATPIAHESAATALVPPFFDPTAQAEEGLPPTFVDEFHDLGAQVGSGVLPGRGLVVLHRGGETNPVVFAMSTTYMVVALAALLALVFLVFRGLTRGRAVARQEVWAGGLRRLLPETTYTATGFSNPVRVIFDAILRPAEVGDSTEAVASHFRTAIRRQRTEIHVVDRFVVDPPVTMLRWLASIVRKMHVGNVNAYAAYVLLVLLIVMAVGAGAF
jgi:hydrogenase-4 component B